MPTDPIIIIIDGTWIYAAPEVNHRATHMRAFQILPNGGDLFLGESWYYSLGISFNKEVSPKKDQTIFPTNSTGSRGSLRTARILACCLLVFPLVGTVSRSGPRARTQSLASSDEASAFREPFQERLRAGSALFQAGRHQEALPQS